MHSDPSANGRPASAPAPSGRRPPLIPPHIAWPGFVVLLLLMSITAGVVTMIAARSDGGAQVVRAAPAERAPEPAPSR